MYTIIGGDGKEYRGISAEILRQWIAEGRLNAQSMGKMDGGMEFRPLSTFPEFADAFAQQVAQRTISAPVNLEDSDYELDIGGCISRGWEVVKNNFWPAVGINALVFIIIMVFNQITGLFTRPVFQAMFLRHEFSSGGIMIVMLVSILSAPLYIVFVAGLMKYFLKLIRKEPATINDAFAGFGPMTGHLILLGFVMNLFVIAGYACCIIPGIYLQVAWMFAVPLIIDRQMNFWEAMKLSHKMVSKHWFLLFGFFIVYILVAMAGVLACCIGVLVTMPISLGVLMCAYETIFCPTQKTVV
jgi:hypothetical protein